MGLSALFLSIVGPYLVTRLGGALISKALISFGLSRAAAGTIAPQLTAALNKLLGGQAQAMTPEEQAALAAHVQQTKPKEVAAHPGVKFHSN